MTTDEATRHPEAIQYTTMAKTLHWAVVALLVIQFALAWTMPGIHRGTQPETLINLHLSVGATILAIVIIRAVWRLSHSAPPPPTGLPAWQLLASRVTHGVLYLLLIAVPVLGWLNASARGWTVTLFWIASLPRLVAEGSPLGRLSGDIHTYASYALLGFAGLHILGALYHRFVLRDRVLERMLPNPP